MTGQKPYVGGVTLLLVQKKSILDTSQSTKSDLLLCFVLVQVSPEHPVIPKTSLHVYQFGITFFFCLLCILLTPLIPHFQGIFVKFISGYNHYPLISAVLQEIGGHIL